MGQEKRNFNMPDAEMLESCTTMWGHFEEDKAEFIDHNPRFADPFSAGWEVKINAALTCGSGKCEIQKLFKFYPSGCKSPHSAFCILHS